MGHTAASRERIRQSLLGHQVSDDTRRKISESLLGRSGSANSSWKGDAIGYGAAHVRVRAEKGSAVQWPCTDCGVTGRHWSYNNQDLEHEAVSPEGLRYSPNPQFYEARCHPCHFRFDRVGAKLTDEAVLEIRQRYGGRYSHPNQRELAAEYGVTPQQVGRIVNHRQWAAGPAFGGDL